MFNHKRIAYKRGGKLRMYSIKTLQGNNADTREFLRLIGYESKIRDKQTVAPEQTAE